MILVRRLEYSPRFEADLARLRVYDGDPRLDAALYYLMHSPRLDKARDTEQMVDGLRIMAFRTTRFAEAPPLTVYFVPVKFMEHLRLVGAMGGS